MPASVSGISKPLSEKVIDPFDPYRKRTVKPVTQFTNILNKVVNGNNKPLGLDTRTGTASSSTSLQAAMQQNEASRLQYTTPAAEQAVNLAGGTDTVATFANISVDEKAYFDAIRPDFYDDNRYLQALKDYDTRISLLNPENLPCTASGFQLVTWPQPGKSASTDMDRPPEFSATTGGIMRTDYTISGETKTYIPVTEWRLIKGAGDKTVGTVYSQQLPWGFRCYFDRGGGPPVHLGFESDKYDSKLEQLLTRTESVKRQDILARLENTTSTEDDYNLVEEEEE